MKNIVELLIDDFHEGALPELMPRHQPMAWMEGKANVVIGMRRAGKTWFCYQKKADSCLVGSKERVGLKKGTIVTWLDEEPSVEGIAILPAWRWSLTEGKEI